MARTVREIEFPESKAPAKKRVVAYARVSSGKDAMLNSLSAQISYYSEFIQKHKGWEYIGVYADEAMSGTKDSREEFQKLLSDCRNGKIDMVITKSISRFARNTVTMLETVRELKSLNVDVFFEKENIHSMTGDGELMLTILASFAQEESLSVSENCKWRIKNKFKEGIPSCATMLGYKLDDGKLHVVPEEANVVKRIFADYLNGMGRIAIANKLRKEGVKTRNGGDWHASTIDRIIKNEKYTGDMILQKTYSSDHIEKKKLLNKGKKDIYVIGNSHEPIVDNDTYMRVQEEIIKRAGRYHPSKETPKKYTFTGKIVCGNCGKNYRRRMSGTHKKAYWICPIYNDEGKSKCQSITIPETILLTISNEVLGILEFDENEFEKRIKKITAMGENLLEFVFYDGKTIQKTWQHKSRSESWSQEKRARARECNLKRMEGLSKS